MLLSDWLSSIIVLMKLITQLFIFKLYYIIQVLKKIKTVESTTILTIGIYFKLNKIYYKRTQTSLARYIQYKTLKKTLYKKRAVVKSQFIVIKI